MSTTGLFAHQIFRVERSVAVDVELFEARGYRVKVARLQFPDGD